MANSFKDIFVDTKISWHIGSSHHCLSFSADGKALAGTTPGTSTSAPDGKVEFWDTNSGEARGSFNNWSWAQFSPTEPDRILVIGGNSATVLKQEAFNSSTWKEQTKLSSIIEAGCYRRDGTRCATTYSSGSIFQWDNAFNALLAISYGLVTSVSSLIYSPDNFLLIGHSDGQLVILNFDNTNTKIGISSVGTVRVSASAWSADGKWLATGDAAGDTRLWNASSTANISLAAVIPRISLNLAIDTLVFVPDSTALIILGGGYIRVWDIGKSGFLDSRAGLPAMANNIALDSARKRVALAVDNKVYLYEIKRPETQPQPVEPKGKPAGGVPPELAAFDITNQVAKTKPDPFVGLYFDIYQGAFKDNSPDATPRTIAIKSLRPGYDASSKRKERQDFEVLFNKCLTTWRGLKNDNILPLMGISMAFGKFPAMITRWMVNGLVTEYINRDDWDEDKMRLVIGIGRGVAYLHSQNIVHSDIRASSVLVNEYGDACLADPGLLNVLEKSPLMAGGGTNAAYRWMAPELMNDPPEKTSFATDAYAFTMTSLEIFTGKQPFAGVGTALIPGRVLQNQRPSRPADTADELWALWNEGWNEDPAKRPDMKSYVSRLEAMPAA